MCEDEKNYMKALPNDQLGSWSRGVSGRLGVISAKIAPSS